MAVDSWRLVRRVSACLQVTKGSVPPNFTLKDQNGRPVSLNKFKGKPVVVYFYPADETPGCTKQVSFCLCKCQPTLSETSSDLLQKVSSCNCKSFS